MRSWRAQALLAAAGLAAVLWAVWWSANPEILCREVVMRPGEVCANAQGTKTQTYEERYAAAQGARPIVGVVGVLVIGFAVVLYRTAGRDASAAAQDSSDIGP